jgi:hypothetical protein
MHGKIQMKKFLRTGGYCLCLLGVVLLVINSIGLVRSLRNKALYTETNTRFPDDITIDLDAFRHEMKRSDGESDQEYSVRINELVQKGISHVIWETADEKKYYLRIPLWENYILYAMSFVPITDEFKRYHFSNYKKSIERGIGVCGDAAVILSGLLENAGIDTNIIAFDGHVINEVEVDDGLWWVFDPDFGVVMPFDLDDMIAHEYQMAAAYRQKGYSESEIDVLKKIYLSKPDVYMNGYDFGPTKYQFEKISYVMIWVIPIFCIFSGFVILKWV